MNNHFLRHSQNKALKDICNSKIVSCRRIKLSMEYMYIYMYVYLKNVSYFYFLLDLNYPTEHQTLTSFSLKNV